MSQCLSPWRVCVHMHHCCCIMAAASSSSLLLLPSSSLRLLLLAASDPHGLVGRRVNIIQEDDSTVEAMVVDFNRANQHHVVLVPPDELGEELPLAEYPESYQVRRPCAAAAYMSRACMRACARAYGPPWCGGSVRVRRCDGRAAAAARPDGAAPRACR